MLVVSSREFRDNQKTYFDKIDEGIKVLIQRGRNKTYELRAAKTRKKAVKKDPYLMTKEEFFAMIDESERQYKEGKFTRISSPEEMRAFFDSL
jgi:hypothetical protein